LKPLEEVQRILIAELVARAPRPRLKPDVPVEPAKVIPAEYQTQSRRQTQTQSQSAPTPVPKPSAPVRLAAGLQLPEPKPTPPS
jgi:hypothetical protein